MAYIYVMFLCLCTVIVHNYFCIVSVSLHTNGVYFCNVSVSLHSNAACFCIVSLSLHTDVYICVLFLCPGLFLVVRVLIAFFIISILWLYFILFPEHNQSFWF